MRRVCIFILPLLTCLACLDNKVFNPVAQLKTDTASIRSFLAFEGIHATKTPQGVWYTLDESALGYYPALADSVTIEYTARLIPLSLPSAPVPISSLQKAGSSATTKSPTRTVLLASIISGMQIGLVKFPMGSSGKLFIPSGLAFGPIHQDSIPANSNLVYEIKLLKATGSRATADQAVLDNYISTISDDLFLRRIKQAKDTISGIRYSYDTIIAANSAPALSNSVTISYSGRVLNASTSFVASADTTLVLKDQITAFKIIFPKMKVGTTFSIYVPSSYAYGNDASLTAIPANSNLVYQITLKGIH
jgi:FKBP-type peptidyl-prolyl cis-trans isomerase